MTTLQEAARKALACLELYDHEDLASCEARHELRTALAQQGERPVAYMAKNKNGGTESLIRARLLEQIGRSDDHDYTPLYAGVAQAPVEQRCTYCDGTGDVHGIDGEWRGSCPCAAAPAPQAQQGAQQPVCHGCGIPAGDVHMSTCQSGKWPSRVSNCDTAAPAPQAQTVAQPLTDKRISWLWNESHNDTTDRMAFQVFARAIEAAHGIREVNER